MAAFQINDAAAVMNVLYQQATGLADINVVDHTTFVDAGTKVLATGEDNVLGAIARTIAILDIGTRPYVGKFKGITATENAFNTRRARISFYNTYNEESGAFNTDLNTNIGQGLDNTAGVGTMWEQRLPRVVETFFLKEAAYDKGITRLLAQLQNAFNNESDFIAFWNGVQTEYENDIEQTTEAKAKALVVDRIAGVYDLVQNSVLGTECAVDMTAYFNAECGTTYTREEILQEHQTEFLEIWAAKLAIDSDRLTERTKLYHDSMDITEDGVDYAILRHTPKSAQKFYYYSELFNKARARVLPTIFNPQYIPETQGEAVTSWQAVSKEDDRSKIACKPALPVWSNVTPSAIELDCVLGILFDEDGIMLTRQFEGAYTTPVEARKLYVTTWNHWKFGALQDYTFNNVIYYMGEGGEESADDEDDNG